MSQNIAIIGSKGAIGKGFVDFYKKQNPSNSILSLSRKNKEADDEFFIDVEDEGSVCDAADLCSKKGPFDKIIIATGILHGVDFSPEKTLKNLNKENMMKVFSINTLGPALVARYFIPLMKKESPSILGFLSARVGSISDNQLGGWYSYRASKAALNMIIKTLSIEVARNNKNAVIVGLHPGTVESNLSNPFQGNVPDGKLFSPEHSVTQMAEVMNKLTPSDSGNCFAWDGKRVEF